jgi:glc operon protein GlcG
MRRIRRLPSEEFMTKKPVPHQHPYGERISLELAKEIAKAGEEFAIEKGWNATIAICDDGGHLVLLHRMSNGQFGSIDLAPPKARAAAAFRRPTKIFHDDLTEGKFTSFWHLRQEAAIPLEGGYPILVGGKLIGGIGVSGVGAAGLDDGDSQVALAALKVVEGK